MTAILIKLWILLIAQFFTFHHGESLATCPPQTVKCNTTLVCIDSRYLCDGDDDCGNGEDELNCGTGDSGCYGEANQTGMNGIITSMGYPANYSNMADCRWFIQVPDGYNIVLEFIGVFDIEKPHNGYCAYDAISIYTYNTRLLQGEYCGVETPDALAVHGSKAIVEFRSDGRTTGMGFKLKWTAQIMNQNQNETEVTTTQPACAGDVLEINNGIGDISSPLFLDNLPYPAPILCRWRITVLSSYVISLNFGFLDLGLATSDDCNGGWLEIYDGHDESYSLIGQFCGNVVPGRQISTSNETYIVMKATDNTDKHMGFTLSFTAYNSELTWTTTFGPPPPGCNGDPLIMTSYQGYVTSPNFNNLESYRDQLDCEWILQGVPGNVFYFRFHEFQLEESGACSYDSLTIYDSNLQNSFGLETTSRTLNTNNTESNLTLTETAKLCGMMLPYDVESTSSRVVLRFHTNEQVGGIGFNLSYAQQPPTVRCREDEFKCGNSKCIKYSVVCDSVNDCSDGTDEVICANSSSCGRPSIQPMFSRIVGGSEAIEGSWPWTVSIVYSIPGPYSHNCGATLILPQWALTATHCFDAFYSRNYEGFNIIAGRHQVNTPDKNEQIRNFGQVFLRHDYELWSSLNDIALIKLTEPFTLTDYISLACLPQEPVPADKLCYVTGWGETLNTCCAGKLKQAAVPIINSTLCAQPDYYDVNLREHMMCAGYPEGGVDTCDGDSGGPLVCETESSDRHWEVQGVTSWGILCATFKRPGVYTVVHDYIQWIQQTIALNTP